MPTFSATKNSNWYDHLSESSQAVDAFFFSFFDFAFVNNYFGRV